MRALRLGATCWLLALVPCSCAPAATPRAREPATFYRSPTHDYPQPARSANDGDVIGAQRQDVDDWIAARLTNDHWAPGWRNTAGQPEFDFAATRVGRGVHVEPRACESPATGPDLPGDAEARAAAARAWLEAARPRSVSTDAVASIAREPSSFLVCNRR